MRCRPNGLKLDDEAALDGGGGESLGGGGGLASFSSVLWIYFSKSVFSSCLGSMSRGAMVGSAEGMALVVG